MLITNWNVTVIANLQSGAVRHHAMEALTALSKYNGYYDKWQQIRQRYSLHRTNGDELFHALQRFFNTDLSLGGMLSRIKGMAQKLLPFRGQIVRFDALVGLRPAEPLESVRLINDNQTFQKYYDPEQMTLCHYKFPDPSYQKDKESVSIFCDAFNAGCSTRM